MKNGANCKVEYKATIGRDIKGKLIRKSFYGKSKREAKAKADQWIIENAVNIQKKGMSGSSPTVQEVSDSYYKEKKKIVRENTANKYLSISKMFLERFGTKKIDRVSKADITAFTEELSEKYSQTYIQTIIAQMSALFNYAIDYGFITVNPCRNVKYKSRIKENGRDVYTEEEAEMIIDYSTGTAEGLSVDIMLSYGTTISETLGIQYSDIDFDNKLIHINRSVTVTSGKVIIDEPKNVHRKRTIAVSDRTIEHIRRFYDPTFKFLIHDPKKAPELPYNPSLWRIQVYNKFMKAMAANFEAEGIILKKLNPHELRHSRATIWVNNDVNLFAIAEEMGWSDLSMLRKVYGHPDINKLRSMLKI